MQIEFLKKHNNLFIYLSIILFSFVFFYYFNAISPVHDPAVFENDLALFYTAGIGMKRGLVVYRDLFDHKGPYIFFLYYFASLIGETNHIGLYIFFSLYNAILGILIYKIVYIYVNKKDIAFFASLFHFVYMYNDFTSFGSICCDHSAYLFIAWAYYLFLNHRKKVYEGKNPNDYINIFFIGIMAGIVLFIKMSMILMLMPIIIIYLIDIIKNRNLKKLVLLFLFGTLGVIVSFIPGLIYIFKNNVFDDFYNTYLAFNSSYLGTKVELFKTYGGYTEPIFKVLDKFKFYILFSIISMVLVYKFYKKYYDKNIDNIKDDFSKELIYFYILSVAFTLMSILLMKRSYSYYTCVLVPMGVSLFCFVYIFISKFIKNNYIKYGIVFILIILSANLTIGKRIMQSYNEYKYVNSLRESYKYGKELLGKDKVKFLSIASPNYYLVFDEIPASKYYVRPMIERSRFSDYYDTIEKDIKEFKYDIFILSYYGDFPVYFTNEFYDFVADNYTYIGELAYDKLFIRKIKED